MLVAEPSIDIGDNRNDMSLETIDCGYSGRFSLGIASRASVLESLEEVVQRYLIRLAQRDIDLLDEIRDCGLLMHRLVGEMAEAITKACDHPARQVDVRALGRAAESLHRLDHLLGVKP